MPGKNILFAAKDFHAVEELKAVLGTDWTLNHAADGAAALAFVATQRCDVLVVDLEIFDGADADFLKLVQIPGPQTIRLILATEADRSRVMKDVPGQHQFLPRPCRAPVLKDFIERTVALDIGSANEDIRKLVSQVRALPPMPSLYLEIQGALESPGVTTAQVSAIIERDMAMTTKLLQILNSAGFGLARKIHDLNEAVTLLGFETVKSMVITIKLMNEFDRIKPVYYSIDRLWRRSTAVARMARELTLLQTKDEALAETAFAAGLLHDIGEAILAATFDEQFEAVQMVAGDEQTPLWEVEKKNFGATHGQLGAYVLGLWGMPLDLLEAAAMHDHPGHCANKQFAAITAVHIAHVWEKELNPENDGSPAPQLDTAYLWQLGLLERLEGWRKALNLPATVKPVVAKKSARKSAKAEKDQPKTSPHGRRNLVLAGSFAILLLAGWFAYGPATRVAARFEAGYTYQPDTRPAPKIAANLPASDAPPANAPHTDISFGADSPGPDSASATNLVSTNAPDLKLQGVFYSIKNPSAIINGRLIHLNGDIDGARVVEITHSTVTVEFRHQRTKLSL